MDYYACIRCDYGSVCVSNVTRHQVRKLIIKSCFLSSAIGREPKRSSVIALSVYYLVMTRNSSKIRVISFKEASTMRNVKFFTAAVFLLLFLSANSFAETQEQILARLKSIEELVVSSNYIQVKERLEQLDKEIEVLLATQLISALPDKVGNWQAAAEGKVYMLGGASREYKISNQPGAFTLILSGGTYGLAGIEFLCDRTLSRKIPEKFVKGRLLVVNDEDKYGLHYTVCLTGGALLISSQDQGMRSEVEKLLDLIDYDSIEKALVSVK